MALLLEVADYGMPAEVASAQDFLDLSQVLLLQGKLEQVIRIVNLLLLQVALAVEGEHLVLHEEGHVYGLVNGLEGA